MSAEYERQLLARARERADLSDIKEDTLTCLGAARHAGLDPGALTRLVGTAVALGATSLETYSAGTGWSGQHADERHFLTHLASIEDEIDDRIYDALRIGRQAADLLTAAQRDLDVAEDQLAAARAMPVSEPCNGCHGEKEAAIDVAGQAIHECRTRTGICEEIIQAMDLLAKNLRYARARIQAVPEDLGETYESVYTLIRSGGRMPHEGRWITGEEARTPA